MLVISPLITNLALILACLIGVLTILWTLYKPPLPSSESARIEFKGANLRFKGRAIFQLFLGAALLVAPVLASNTNKPAVAFTPPHEDVPRIPDPSYQDFVFLRDISVVDLRGSKAQPLLTWIPHFGKKTNPATLVNTMLIKKVAAVDTIKFKYSTSGALDIRCLSHSCVIKHATNSGEYPGGDIKEAWELTADVRDIPIGGEFQMIVEVTFWNAFDTPQKQWYATYSNNQSDLENVSMLLIFPEESPFKDYKEFTFTEADKTLRPFQGQSKIVPGPGNHSLYWEVPTAQPNSTFRLDWTY